jgi:cytochrome P450
MHALYNLAAHPEYIQPLRQEVESYVANGGWEKSTVREMRKLDSFLKECFRLHPMGASKRIMTNSVLTLAGTQRVVVKPYKFSNGVTIRPGATLTSLILPIHLDEDNYKNADQFDGFRFSRMRESEDHAKYLSANTSPEFLFWSHGEHAW